MRSPLAVIAAGFASLVACVAPTPGVDARALHAAGAPVVDVRSAGEWAEGHLAGSTLVPLPELPKRVKEITALVGGDKTKPVIVVCRSGGRAGQARTLLLNEGFTNVINAGAWESLR